jgi:hypothetical protein
VRLIVKCCAEVSWVFGVSGDCLTVKIGSTTGVGGCLK